MKRSICAAGNQVRQRGRNDADIFSISVSGSLKVPDPHLYFQAPGGQCLRFLESTRTSPFMVGPERPERGKGKRGTQKNVPLIQTHLSDACAHRQ